MATRKRAGRRERARQAERQAARAGSLSLTARQVDSREATTGKALAATAGAAYGKGARRRRDTANRYVTFAATDSPKLEAAPTVQAKRLDDMGDIQRGRISRVEGARVSSATRVARADRRERAGLADNRREGVYRYGQ